MFDYQSDCESAFSIDSLEEEASEMKFKDKLVMESKSIEKQANKNMTVPFYNGEISIGEIIPKLEYNSRNSSDMGYSKSTLKAVTSRTLIDFKGNKKVTTDQLDNHCSFFCDDFPKRHLPESDIYRLSRRKDKVTVNVKNSSRLRNRSVSYLEQFKKKMYGINNKDPSIHSMAGSDLTGRDESLSYLSCFSGDGINSTSEYDYYEKLIENSRSGQITLKNEDILKSSTALTIETKRSPKKSKGTNIKPKIISSVCHLKKEEANTEVNKKGAFEKREVYANKIKLRNQLKINRQKQREQTAKFQYPDMSVIISSDDCLLQSHSRTTVNNRNSSNKEEIPYSIDESTKFPNFNNETKQSRRKLFHRTAKSKLNETPGLKHNRKDNKLSELSNLQQRHEIEKSLVESIRNLILKA